MVMQVSAVEKLAVYYVVPHMSAMVVNVDDGT